MTTDEHRCDRYSLVLAGFEGVTFCRKGGALVAGELVTDLRAEVAALRTRLAAAEAERDRLARAWTEDHEAAVRLATGDNAALFAYVDRAEKAEAALAEARKTGDAAVGRMLSLQQALDESKASKVVCVVDTDNDTLHVDCRQALAEKTAEVARLRAELSDDGVMRLEGEAAEKFLAKMEAPLSEAEQEKRRLFLKECDEAYEKHSPLVAAQRALAAVQAENARLREALKRLRDSAAKNVTSVYELRDADAALASPGSNEALRDVCGWVAEAVLSACGAKRELRESEPDAAELRAIVARILGLSGGGA